MIDTLYRRWRGGCTTPTMRPAPFEAIKGLEHLDKVIDIDQIADRPHAALATRPPTPASSTRSANCSRRLPEARARGYEPGRFSFNVKGGRCETCQGDGVIKIEMHFLPDVYVTCDVCKGKRYNRETLEITFKGKNIADVLDMTVEEGVEFFRAVPAIRELLETLARGRPRLHPARPAGDHALRRRGAAREAGDGTSAHARPARRSTFWTSRRPACISTTWRSCWKCCIELVEQRQHAGGDRAQSRRDQDRRLDHRSRPRRRRRAAARSWRRARRSRSRR